ncbi:hypothetical protein G5V59_24295 [Nocardioides sp. W3-2-3]|uniref:hypothetical protein n=1 Tax=Nocardioides convexus TaxID=2712224 RepID=UPI002418692A|nr:hypothetical protein [Nocardioides convexus]NHA01762.1 hypothetical protein [Nocardioides convexus]
MFDRILLDVVTEVDERWSSHLGLVEYAVEDIPQAARRLGRGAGAAVLLGPGLGRHPDPAGGLPPSPRAPRPGPRRAWRRSSSPSWWSRSPSLLGIEPSEVDPRYPTDDD